MQDELADAHAARAALAADLAGVRERAAHLEQQLEASEEVRRCLAQELAQANALRQRLEARGHPPRARGKRVTVAGSRGVLPQLERHR